MLEMLECVYYIRRWVLESDLSHKSLMTVTLQNQSSYVIVICHIWVLDADYYTDNNWSKLCSVQTLMTDHCVVYCHYF